MPEIIIKSKEVEKGISFLEFVANNKIVSSKSEARRIIANKGFKINNIVIKDEKKNHTIKRFQKNFIKLSYGKKKHYLVKII